VSEMPPFRAYQTEEFEKRFGKLDKSVRERVLKGIGRLLDDPARGSKLLQEPFKGKRSFRQGDYRVILSICEECRKNDWKAHNSCNGCEGRPDRSVILFTIGHRKNVYD